MEPDRIRFGGGTADTILHPFFAVAMVLAIILILCLPRKYVVVSLLFGTFTIPLGQVVVLAGMHFTVLRILILVGLLRWAVSQRPSADGVFTGGFNPVDRVTVLWTSMTFVIFSIQWMESQAFIRSLGDLLDKLGGYLVLRFFIQDTEDIKRVLKVFAAICVLMGVCMINEQITQRNIFGLLGGTGLVPQIRDGKVRSQGAFGVYIDAGVFAGTLIPLFIWLWAGAKSRLAAGLGILGATAMTVTSNASTSQLAYVSGLVALCFWPLRNRMRQFRWGLVIVLTALHFVMKAPVWALIARIDLTGSSSGYHRYQLVDNCIRHFTDWWLLGTKVYDSWGWDMWDLSNQFVACAFTGGLVVMALFIAILSRSFGAIGKARKLVEGNRAEEWYLWYLGAALFATVVAFFGCSYMAQMQMEFFALLSMISVATFEAMKFVPAMATATVTVTPRLIHVSKAMRTRNPVGETK
jgi:hypothetical protein